MFGLELSYKTFNNNNATPPQAQKKGVSVTETCASVWFTMSYTLTSELKFPIFKKLLCRCVHTDLKRVVDICQTLFPGSVINSKT